MVTVAMYVSEELGHFFCHLGGSKLWQNYGNFFQTMAISWQLHFLPF